MRPGRIRREGGIERAITKVGAKTVWSRINDVDRNGTTKKVVFYEREERCSVEGKVRKARGSKPTVPEKIIIEGDNIRTNRCHISAFGQVWTSSDASQDIETKKLVNISAPRSLID